MKLKFYIIYKLIIVYFIISNVNSVLHAELLKTVPSPFLNVLKTPVVDPYYRKPLENSLAPKNADPHLEKKVKTYASEILNHFISCFDNAAYLDSADSASLITVVKSWIKDINKIKVYVALETNTSAQMRFGATNSISHEIIINANYPQLFEPEMEKVFYLHEAFGAIGINDRWYAVTSTLWSISQLCKTTHSNLNFSNVALVKKIDFLFYLMSIIKPLIYDSKKPPKSEHDKDLFADGGVTGVGSGGDPVVAFFQANLYKEALKRDFSNQQLTSFFNSVWLKLTKLRTEGYPELKWFAAKRDLHNMANLSNFKMTSDEMNDYINSLNKTYNQLNNVHKISDMISEYGLSMGILRDRSKVFFIDNQLFYMLYILESEKMSSLFGSLTLDLIIPHL